jgi:hypothetical protein
MFYSWHRKPRNELDHRGQNACVMENATQIPSAGRRVEAAPPLFRFKSGWRMSGQKWIPAAPYRTSEDFNDERFRQG